ncbi:MAG: transglycosylase SLT domain-containing protein, partial [Bacteroidia bacterium]
ERKPLQKISIEEWKCQADCEKENYRDYLCYANSMDSSSSIYATAGKKEFYEHRKVIPQINIAVEAFLDNNTDPWYAQTILLIESPGKMTQKSSAGAYGPFQLMKSVARKYGLKINKYKDERTDLIKAAGAASKLLSNVCIPRVKNILDLHKISYNETDLWFRFLVMHVYHAGAGNVDCVINELNPSKGGIDLFLKIWNTECRGFKNESQNYSQIALANLIIFDKIINAHKDTVFMVQGDRVFGKYKRTMNSSDAIPRLNNSLSLYESDFLDGIISFEYFVKKITAVQKELVYISNKNAATKENISANKVPLNNEQCLNLGDQLLKKKKVEEAIKVFKLNVEQNPKSSLAYDSLGRAYRILGKNDLALKYSTKSAALRKGN